MIKFLLEIIAIIILVKVFLFAWEAVPKLLENGQGTLHISISTR